MKRILLFCGALLVSLGIAGAASACQSNADCSAGGKCQKKGNSLYGVCVGGVAPGEVGNRKPATDPRDVNNTLGATCRHNADCGPRSKCQKSTKSPYGTCVR